MACVVSLADICFLRKVGASFWVCMCLQASLEQAVAELRQRLAQQAQRLADSLQCFKRVQGELQQENAALATALSQRTADYQDLMQEKEVGLFRWPLVLRGISRCLLWACCTGLVA
jgi:hypothetical protein